MATRNPLVDSLSAQCRFQIYYLYTDDNKNRALLSPLVSAFESIAPARMMLSLRGAASANIVSVSALPLSGTGGLPLTLKNPDNTLVKGLSAVILIIVTISSAAAVAAGQVFLEGRGRPHEP